MRTIKFRGKRLDGEWVYGFYQPHANGKVIFIGDYSGLTDIPKLHKVIPESVGQWTGRTDKNGVELYEGDVAKIFVYYYDYDGSKYYMEEECRFGRVTFQDGVYYLGTTPLMHFSTDEYEIIHDNPELMEVE